jgi:hypothetical protein
MRKLRRSGEIEEKCVLPLRNIYSSIYKALQYKKRKIDFS